MTQFTEEAGDAADEDELADRGDWAVEAKKQVDKLIFEGEDRVPSAFAPLFLDKQPSLQGYQKLP